MSPTTKRWLFLTAQLAFAGAAVWYAGRTIAAQWGDVATVARGVELRWSLVLASAAPVACAYALLIHSWRVVLAGVGGRLTFGTAARIWFVSNLGRWIPGKVWSITAMAVMAQRHGVSPADAAGSSLVVTLVNTLAGFAVAFATGARIAEIPRSALVALVVLTVGLVATPFVLPQVGRLASRVRGTTVEVPNIPPIALAQAAVWSAVAWLLYGLAFRLFALGIGVGAGGTAAYVAVYSLSYLTGFLVLVAPGGIGVREAVMVTGLVRLGLAAPPQAVLLAVASRLWLTVLETLPGVVLLAAGGSPRLRNP